MWTELTITTTSVSPRRGSTAGGTSLTIQVAGLPSGTTSADVAVTVVGLPCTVTDVSAAEVKCTTSSYGVTSLAKPGSGAVSVTLPAIGTGASTSNATYEYIALATHPKDHIGSVADYLIKNYKGNIICFKGESADRNLMYAPTLSQ